MTEPQYSYDQLRAAYMTARGVLRGEYQKEQLEHIVDEGGKIVRNHKIGNALSFILENLPKIVGRDETIDQKKLLEKLYEFRPREENFADKSQPLELAPDITKVEIDHVEFRDALIGYTQLIKALDVYSQYNQYARSQSNKENASDAPPFA